jgi:type II secretory pathway component GspD/PulD (secretin)
VVALGNQIAGASNDAPISFTTLAGVGGVGGGGSKKVTVEFKDVPVVDALKQLAKEANTSFAIKGELPKDLRVTVYLQDVSGDNAMRLLCDAAGLAFSLFDQGVWGRTYVISVRPTVTVSGTQVPVVGAWLGTATDVEGPKLRQLDAGRLAVELGAHTDVERAKLARLFTGGSTAPSKADRALPSFAGQDTFVDLEVKDVPLAAAIAQLSKSSGVAIVVDRSVPEALKVTAKVHGLTLGQTLSMLVQQAHLIYNVGQTKDGKAEIRVIPPPEVQVSGLPGEAPMLRCENCGALCPSVYFEPLDAFIVACDKCGYTKVVPRAKEQ